MRLFIFNAFLSVGTTDKKLSLVIEDITIESSYSEEACNVACPLENFTQALDEIGYQYDAAEGSVYELLNPKNRISVSSQVSEFDGYIYFQGTPLQFTGFTDPLTKPIYEGHKIKGYTVFFCQDKGQWRMKKGNTTLPLYQNVKFFIEGYDLPLTPSANVQ